MSPTRSGRAPSRGFTLLELLVVVGLIAGLSFFLLRSLGPGSGNSLQSAQAQLANLVTAARLKAAATGKRTRLLFHVDLNVNPDARYLRFVVLQQGSDHTTNPSWTTIESGFLPENTFVVPSDLASPEGLVADREAWKKVSTPSEFLISDMLAHVNSLQLDIDDSVQLWAGFVFTANGTLAPFVGSSALKGNLAVTLGRSRAPGSFEPGQSPVRLLDPESVRGVALSAYGVPAMLNERTAF